MSEEEKRLRGLISWASGKLFEAGDVDAANTLLECADIEYSSDTDIRISALAKEVDHVTKKKAIQLVDYGLSVKGFVLVNDKTNEKCAVYMHGKVVWAGLRQRSEKKR